MKELSLWLYLLVHWFTKALANPRALMNALQQTAKIWNTSRLSGLRNYWLGKYLPENYLLKTRYQIRQPSPSIYKKILPVLGNNFFIPASSGPLQMKYKPRILIIRSGAMGDVLLLTPIIRQIYLDRQGFCEIDIATHYAELFDSNPYISQVISIKDLKRNTKSYDWILNLDMAIERNKNPHITHSYGFYAFGLRNFNGTPEVFSKEEDKQVVGHYIKKLASDYIVVHNRHDPTQPYRHIDVELWKKFLICLSEIFKTPILQIGIQDLDIALDTNPYFLDTRGKFNLAQTKELISHAKLFIGTDGGPLHIAACTDTPIVGFFTLVHHSSRQPLRENGQFIPITPLLDCYGCVKDYPTPWGFDCRRGDHACVRSFDMESALLACKELMNNQPLKQPV